MTGIRKIKFNYGLQRVYKNSVAVSLFRALLSAIGQPVYLMPVRGFRLVTSKHFDGVE